MNEEEEIPDIRIRLKSGNYQHFFHDTKDRISLEDFVKTYEKKVANMDEAIQLLGLKSKDDK